MNQRDNAACRDGAGQRRGTLTAVTLALFCVEVSLLALMLALPDMARLLRNSPEATQDALSAYLLSLGAALTVAGRIGDILGHRRLFVVGCLLFAVALVGSALSPGLLVLVVFRVLQGAGAGLVLPSGIALVRASYPGADRQARALGLCFALAATGTVAGPLLGGWLAEGPGWPWIFWLLVPVVAAAIALAVRFVPESRTRAQPPSFDLVGAAMVVLGVAAIGTGIDRADSVGWSGVNIVLLAAGLVIMALFALRSRRTAHPLVDLSVFGNPRFALVLFLSSVGAACYAATIFVVSVYLQDARGLTAVRAGLVFAVMAVLQSLAAPVGARLQRRARPLLVLAGAGVISGAALIALTAVTSWWAYVPVLALCGFGLGLEYAVASIASQQAVGPGQAGEVSGIVLALRTTIAGLSLAAAASIVEAVEHGGRGIGAACDVTLLIVAFLSLAASLIATSARYVFVRHGLI